MIEATALDEGTYTAVVRAADGVRFSASATSDSGLTSQLADYIRDRYEHVLWAPAAQTVRALLDNDAVDEAIATYFDNVGDRWDAEELDVGRSSGTRLPASRPAESQFATRS